jgi:MscS family membrane protein
MLSPIQDRRTRSTFLKQNRALVMGLALFLFAGSSATVLAQLPQSPAAPSAKPDYNDPLQRETPRRALEGFLMHEQREDFVTAARYLEAPPGRKTNLPEVARELAALRGRFKSNLALVSDDPNGTVEAGLPPGQVRAGVLQVGTASADVILVRVDDPSYGKIWLLSKELVAKVPQLYAERQHERPTAVERILPAALSGEYMLGMSLAQWLGWLLSIPISWVLAWLAALLLSVPRRIWRRIRKVDLKLVWETEFGQPLRCIIAILIHSVLVYLLGPPLLYRAYYFRFLAALLVACLAWFVGRVTDRGFKHEVNRRRTQLRGGEAIVVLVQRVTRIVLAIIAIVTALAFFGIDVKTTLAGLGIGGVAIALAAQKTLENLIGGISLLMDKAIQTGDFCSIGGRLGTVEDIGLRSLRLRTLDQNLLVVPNGVLASSQFENMKNRSKLLISQKFSLRIETKVEQLRLVLDRVQRMLDQHPSIESGTSRIRVANFADAAFELELWAYVTTGDWASLTVVRQDIILKIAEIVERAGTQLAGPTRLMYISAQAGMDAGKVPGLEAA